MHTHTYTHTHTYIYIYIHTPYTHVHTYKYTHIHIHNHDKPKQFNTNHCNTTSNKRHTGNNNSDNLVKIKARTNNTWQIKTTPVALTKTIITMKE